MILGTLVLLSPLFDPPLAAPAAPGDPLPDFALADLDGREHRLADQRGKIVVLEWTSPLCPAVAAFHETGLGADTRRAVAGDDVVWWRVDSSFFAAERASQARSWCERLALDDPFLIDAEGSVARALGARATPHLFVVDARGRLAYAGAATDRGGLARRNYVVEAVRALRAGLRPATTTTRAEGCSVKLGPPPAGVTWEDYDEERVPREHYERAARRVGEQRLDAALEAFEQALRTGLSRPMRILADARFRPLLARAEARDALRRLLGDRPPRGAARIVAPDEPGEPFVLAGTVRDAEGQPIPDAVVSLYQTDDAGWYAPGSTSGENPRLFGRVITDGHGNWRVRTIVPGYYADSHAGLRHFHIGFRAPGYRPFEGHRASVYFADDPNLVGANLDEIRSDGCAILARAPNAEGIQRSVYRVTLESE